MADGWITVEAEVGEVVRALEGTSHSLTAIQRQALGIIARRGVRKIRGEIRAGILDRRRSTGELARSYGFRVRRDGSEANIYPRGAAGSGIFPKAFVNNYGYDGATARAGRWSVAPKNFVGRTEDFLRNTNFDGDLEKMVDRALEKYWG